MPCSPQELRPGHATLRRAGCAGQLTRRTTEELPAVARGHFWGAHRYPEAKRDKGRGRGNTLILAKQSVLCEFCGVGGKGGKQLEGIPINTDMSRREGLCLQHSPPLTWHHYVLPALFLHWQVPAGPGFGCWEVQRHSSAPSGALGGEKYTNQAKVRVQSSLVTVPFLLESQARPGVEETGK